MWGRRLSELLALPVRTRGIVLGHPEEALVAAAEPRIVGFELLCGDGARRFLPFAVAQLGADEIAVESPLLLLDEDGLDYYRERTRRLRDLALVDPWVDAEGCIYEALTAA
jgi:hypothetical protein